MLMLILPVVSVVEVLRGEIVMAPPAQEEDMQPLYDGEMIDNPKVINKFP